MGNFYQDPPRLGNQWDEDAALQRVLRVLLPPEVYDDVRGDLQPFGARVVGDVQAMGEDAEARPPRLVSYDAWGRRIDRIEVAQGWTDLDRVSAEEGIVAIAYERAHGVYSRVHQAAKLYLFAPASAVYSCPLAMTDGAARLIEVHGDRDLRQRVLPRLTTRDPGRFWTSGQWMTERTGGSDVGGTSTVARPCGDGFLLTGDKWFTSATTSQTAMTLARIEDDNGEAPSGSRGLSLFYLETRRADGSLNGITIHRLKEKLGTKALPTAELSLEGCAARLIGGPGEGVRRIASLINVTRVYNSICAVAGMRRAIALARDYARRRRAFGKLLCEHPLHVETLADLQLEYEGCLALVFHLAALLGKEETGEASAGERAVARILTPAAKLYTAKQAVATASEVLECFGGAGYVEDTGLPRLLRDAQVLSIWEGTTNILSLDVLRSMAKEATLEPLLEDAARKVESPGEGLEREAQAVRQAAGAIRAAAMRFLEESEEFAQASARGFAFSVARTSIAALLIDHARRSAPGDARPHVMARRWCARNLAPLVWGTEARRRESLAVAMEEPIGGDDVDRAETEKAPSVASG